MNSDFWIKKWQEGDIRFHQTEFHPALRKYGDRFSPGALLVPLCGKTLDMVYLASKGHSVIGVELSPVACRNFFQENGFPFSEKAVNDFVVFQSDKITLWCGDFFKLPNSVWDTISGVYDRAALVALPAEVRAKYAAETAERSTKHLEILLIAFEYPDGSMQGPPFSVPEQEIKTLYKRFEMEKVHSEKEDRNLKDHPKLKSIEVTETVYWLQKRV